MSSLFAATKDLPEEEMRLDVATPQSVFLNESFDLAVAVVQPGAPPLTIDDLPAVAAGQGPGADQPS